MNEEIIKEIERELNQRKEKISALQWLEFWDEFTNEIANEDLTILLDGIERIKLEKKLEGYNIGLNESMELIDKQVNNIKGMLVSHVPDSSYSFLDKLRINFEKLKLAIESKKVKE